MEIWHVDLDRAPGAFAQDCALLDPDRRERCARLRSPVLRRRYAAAHATLRRLLARRLDRPPAQIPLAQEANGRPMLPAGIAAGRDLHLSLSHAGGHALVALRLGQPVGVDIELLPASPGLPEDLAPHLSSDEHAHLEGLPPPQRPTAALRLWTCKEALLKATGQGLSVPPAGLSVAFEPRPHLASSRLPGLDPAGWSLDVRVHEGVWTAAVAWPEITCEPVHWLQWPADACARP